MHDISTWYLNFYFHRIGKLSADVKIKNRKMCAVWGENWNLIRLKHAMEAIFFLFPRTCSHNFQHDNKNRKMFSAVIENEHLAINSLSLMLIFMKIDWFVGVARPVSILELRWLLPIKMQRALEFPSNNNKHCQTECNKNLRLCTSIEQRRMPKRIFFFFSFLHSFLSLYSDWWVVKR